MVLRLSVFLLIALLLPMGYQRLCGVIVGSNTTPSRQAAAFFPTTDNNNTILGFADLVLGFSLGSHRATCTYDNLFPVSGFVALRGGQLHLKKDLIFGKTLVLTTSGSIFGASNALVFPKTIPDFNLTSTLVIDKTNIVFVNGVKISAPLQFRYGCKINGMGKRLTFMPSGALITRPGGSLVIENAELWNLSQRTLRCLTDEGSITLRNCTLVLGQDYTFSRGSMLFTDEVIVTGTSRFIYSSGLTSTISSVTTLFLDSGITFSYSPRRASGTLINMVDNTSYLYLNGGTLHSTRTGLQLSTGTLIVDDKVTFSSEARRSVSEALRLNSDLTIRIKGRGTADFNGLICYE